MPREDESSKEVRRQVPAVKVNQWLADWDKVKFLSKEHRRKPPSHFFVFSLPAVELRTLCGIARRQTSGVTPRAADLGIQRQHDPERSDEIAQFVQYGYPWSTLSEAKRKSTEFHDLRKPGWLPTSIVINILTDADKREGKTVSAQDIVNIEEGSISRVILPYSEWSKNWHPSEVPPFEVIDGQHRLWSFTRNSPPDFELPIVAFQGLDISWQAYLFWTINIKPKRINPSLAFDLYPLLRAEDWLDQAEGHSIYRETRSQELTEALWAHPESPWYDKINMLGERPNPWVSQSAWIKSLVATFVRRWQGRGSKVGGLFGSRLAQTDEVLGWSRAQQAAFLILAWAQFQLAVQHSEASWVVDLRTEAKRSKRETENRDQAFYGPYSLINTDQGVRGFLHVLNDTCFAVAARLQLGSWQLKPGAASDENAVTLGLQSLRRHGVADWLKQFASHAATFDWRTSATPSLSEEERRQKLVFRGSSGYKELRGQLLEHLGKQDDEVGRAAKRVHELV